MSNPLYFGTTLLNPYLFGTKLEDKINLRLEWIFGQEFVPGKYGENFPEILILCRLWRFEEQPFNGLPCPGSQNLVRPVGLTERAIHCCNLTSTEK